MGHIHTGDGEHDHTASAFIVRRDFDEPKLLLHLHKKLHVLLQPGGHIELNETPWQSITHELREETGYDLDQLHILQPKTRIDSVVGAVIHPVPAVHNTHYFDSEGKHRHTDVSYAFVTNEAPRHSPADGESVDIRWVSAAELEALDSSQIFDNVREIGRFVLTTLLEDWQPVNASTYQR